MPALADDLRSRFTGDPEYVARWAELPAGSRPLENPRGGAPGFRIQNAWVLPGLPARDEGDVRPVRGGAARRAADRLVAAPLRPAGVDDHARARGGDDALARAFSSAPTRRSHAEGPSVEVVLKSSDPALLEAATAFLVSELDRLT